MYDTIPINKELVPYTFSIELAGEMFDIRVDYNSVGDTFVLSLWKDNELVCAGEPIIYGVPLWKDVYKAGKFPAVDIIPIDASGETSKVTYDNLGRTVVLALDNREVSILNE